MAKLAKLHRESNSDLVNANENDPICEPKTGKIARTLTPVDDEVLRELDELVVDRLFGDRRWPPKKKGIVVIREVLERLKLLVPGTWQSTPVGTRYRVDLVLLFTGILNDIDIWYELYANEFLRESEGNPWRDFQGNIRRERRAMKMDVQKAYFRFYNRARESSRFPLIMQAFAANHQRQLEDSHL